jgi:hypothetical protein
MSYPSVCLSWSWDAQPEFNCPSLGSPIPCRWGSGCVYTQCCSFVHPGEEGTGRKLFDARLNEKTGIWEKATVRLIGSPRFYERRRLRMSWPRWCEAQGMAAPVPQSQRKARAPCLDLSDNTEQVIEAQKKLLYQNMGNILYSGASRILAENKDALKIYDFWHPTITPGKITGVIMEAYANELDSLFSLLNDTEQTAQLLADACECIYMDACEKEHAKFLAGAEPTPDMLKMAKHHEMVC